MTMDRTPLAAAVQEYIEGGAQRGHMPGHKGAKGGYLARFGELADWDLTEVKGLDDLHCPVGVIRESERLMAAAVGANSAYFLINGATVGIQAAILSACRPSETILLPRNAHRAVWSALAIGDVRPLWLEVAEEADLALGITPDELDKVLSEHSEVRAVFLINPTFYGVLPNMRGLLEVARRHGVYTIVDEAHGAHFAFTAPKLSAARMGADLVIDSWHKSMGSLGQTAVLLCNNEELLPERWLTLLQSTSPSYPLMCSLDLARAEWEREKDERTRRMAENRRLLEQTVAECECLRIIGGADMPSEFQYDETKILLYSRTGHSGRQLAEALRQVGVEPEFADARFVLLLLTYADSAELWAEALRQADREIAAKQAESLRTKPVSGLPEYVLTPFAAAHSPVEQVPLSAAAGRISAGLLVPYPPGIATVGPGEVISAEAAAFLSEFGGEVQGVSPTGLVDVIKADI